MDEKRTEILNERSSLNFQPGEVFAGRYRIIEQIGQGGMGKVFKAIDLELSETVALKMIRPELSDKPEIVERFKRELQLARKINHPHVIRIHDLGFADGIRYISMKYIEGQSLKDLIHVSGRLTVDKAIEIAGQIAEALSAAHASGVVHRDLKPQNIMMDRSGNAVVLDFGIARSVSAAPLTGTGIVIGTPNFMSPEQILGGPVDARSDIYSFGVILYEMVTGRPPFIEDNSTILLYSHLNEKPAPPSSLNKDVPEWLDSIILRCLGKKPGDRFASVSEMIHALAGDDSRKERKTKAGAKRFWAPWVKMIPRERKWLRGVARVLVLAFSLYIACSLIGWITDGIYGRKLKELIKKSDQSFSNRFPIVKDYIPSSWEKRNCDAWDTYRDLFPVEYDPRRSPEDDKKVQEYTRLVFKNPGRDQLNDLVSRLMPADPAQVQRLVKQLETRMKMAEFDRAIRCSLLRYPLGPDDDNLYNFRLVFIYSRFVILQARADFLSGELEAGLQRLNSLLVFSMDLLLTSKFYGQVYNSLSVAKRAFREALPLLMDPAWQASSGNAVEFELLLRKTIMKMRMELLRSLLHLEMIQSVNYDVYGSSDSPGGTNTGYYFMLGRMKYWRSFFSGRKLYFEQTSRFSELDEGFSMITKTDKILKFIKKFRDGHPFEMYSGFKDLSYRFCLCRTLAKLALLTLHARSDGYDSKKFADFKASEYFTNDITGNPFEMIKKDDGTILVVIDQNLNFSIRPAPYQSEYLFTLRSFSYLDKDKQVLEGLD